MAKVKNVLKGSLKSHVEFYDLSKVEFVEVTEGWGNLVFRSMVLEYACFLALIDYNNPVGWKSE
jgi:hypothetical protein